MEIGELNVDVEDDEASRLAPNVKEVVASGEDWTPARSIPSTVEDTVPLVTL
jgi:hypothetical protein